LALETGIPKDTLYAWRIKRVLPATVRGKSGRTPYDAW